MTRDETKQILMRIQSTFPNWKPQSDLRFTVETWHEYLSDYDYEQVRAALKAFVMTDSSGFLIKIPAPTACLRQICLKRCPLKILLLIWRRNSKKFLERFLHQSRKHGTVKVSLLWIHGNMLLMKSGT